MPRIQGTVDGKTRAKARLPDDQPRVLAIIVQGSFREDIEVTCNSPLGHHTKAQQSVVVIVVVVLACLKNIWKGKKERWMEEEKRERRRKELSLSIKSIDNYHALHRVTLKTI